MQLTLHQIFTEFTQAERR